MTCGIAISKLQLVYNRDLEPGVAMATSKYTPSSVLFWVQQARQVFNRLSNYFQSFS